MIIRILFSVAGITSIGGEPLWLSIILFALRAAFALAAMLGSRKTIEASLDAVNIIHLLDSFF